MRISVLSIFPDYLAPLHQSLVGRAIADGLIDLTVRDLRDYATDRHRTVDDTPYGGGAGMVMKPDVWASALDDLAGDGATLIIPTPAGRLFTQQVAVELASTSHLVFACGRYEGIDQRVADEAASRLTVRELSIGDYVLAGGEAAALVIIEAVARLLPGVLGNPESAITDSFGSGSPGLLEHPSFTRPVDHRGRTVPAVLLSGHHGAIQRWRRDESLRRTAARRPDLIAELDPAGLDARDREVLGEAVSDSSGPDRPPADLEPASGVAAQPDVPGADQPR